MSNPNASRKYGEKNNSSSEHRRVILQRERNDGDLASRQGPPRSAVRRRGHSELREATSLYPHSNRDLRGSHSSDMDNDYAITEDHESMLVDEDYYSQDHDYDSLSEASLICELNLAPKYSLNSDEIKGLLEIRQLIRDSFTAFGDTIREQRVRIQELERKRAAEAEAHMLFCYVLKIAPWIGYTIDEWWGLSLSGIHQGALFKSNDGEYDGAFKAAGKHFMKDKRKLFRDLHSALTDQRTFEMCREFKYDELAAGLPPNNTDGSKGDKAIVIIKMTPERTCASIEIVQTFVKHVTTYASGPDMLENFKRLYIHEDKDEDEDDLPMFVKDFNHLVNLLETMCQLEVGLTLQVHRYRKTEPGFASSKDVRKRLRCALVTRSEPDPDTLQELFASRVVATAFRHLSSLFARGHFKTVSHRLGPCDELDNSESSV